MENGNGTAITISGLSKAFGSVKAVDGLNLEVPDGSICALLGPSGCGKTTTLRLVAGFERPDDGSVQIGDRVVTGPSTFIPPERRRIGMVFQDYALFPHYDVAGNVAYALGRNRSAERVSEILRLVGLEEIADRRPDQLSGGQQQRIALARALAPTPEVILLDEPFSNLDAALRAEVRAETRQILRAANVTAVFVTHDQEEALSLADTVAVMNDGLIEQVGTPEEVYGRPATRWVANFLGDAEVLPGTVSAGQVECELARLSLNPGFEGPCDIVIRPESIAIAAAASGSRGDEHEGIVVDREFYGHDQLVVVELPSGLRIRSRSAGFPAWHPGDRVRVWLDGPVNVMSPSQ